MLAHVQVDLQLQRASNKPLARAYKNSQIIISTPSSNYLPRHRPQPLQLRISRRNLREPLRAYEAANNSYAGVGKRTKKEHETNAELKQGKILKVKQLMCFSFSGSERSRVAETRERFVPWISERFESLWLIRCFGRVASHSRHPRLSRLVRVRVQGEEKTLTF